MRINKFIAQSSTLSRRAADAAITAGQVRVNGQLPTSGQDISDSDTVMLDGQILKPSPATTTIMLNKPTGYVVSRNGQGSKTIYDILPAQYQQLQPVGRLDKDSSGLLLLTNNGELAQQLTHPKYQKLKIYEISLDRPLEPLHQQLINDHGITLEDGPSQLQLEKLDNFGRQWRIQMHEGRNRQIRRTFAALGYSVITLRRTAFGSYQLADLLTGAIRKL